jgi:transposase InsO family protein
MFCSGPQKLELALTKGRPEIHHSDQGLQYAALDYTARLQSVGAPISMAEVGQSAQNGYAERVIRTISVSSFMSPLQRIDEREVTPSYRKQFEKEPFR